MRNQEFNRKGRTAEPEVGNRQAGDAPLDDWVPVDYADFGGASHARTSAARANANVGALKGRPPVGAHAAGAPTESSPAQQPVLIKHRHKRHRHRKAKIAGIVAACVVAVVVCYGALLAHSAGELRDQAAAVSESASELQSQIESSDFEGAAQSARSLQSAARGLNSGLSQPLWRIASLLPGVGQDIDTALTVSEALVDASDNAVVPLTDELARTPFSSLITSDGAIDAQALGGLLSVVQQSAPAMQRATDAVDGAPAFGVEQLRNAFEPAREKLDSVNATVQQAAEIAPVAGAVLGANGDRTYLVAAQNSSELRASGGFPGSVGTLSIAGGKLSLGEFGAVYDYMVWDTPASLSATDEEQAIFYDYLSYGWDLSFNPDFPRTAEVYAASYRERTGNNVDGVAAVTPNVVQDLLSALGTTVTLSDGTQLNGTNATKALEHDLYWKYLAEGSASGANDKVDGLFAEAAQKTFSAVISDLNGETLPKIAKVLAQEAQDRSLMLWLSNADEQADIQPTDLSGSLDASTQQRPELGVFANIWMPSKLGWWFGMDTQLGEPETAADGTRTYHVVTTLTNSITADEIATGGDYMLGFDSEQGNIKPFVYLYAPAGGTVENVSASNGAAFTQASYKGLQVTFTPAVGKVGVFLAPNNPLWGGDTVTVSYDVVLPASVQGDLQVKSVPTLQKYH